MLIFWGDFFTIRRDMLIQGRKKYVKKNNCVGCVVDINVYVMKALISAS